MTTKIRLTNTSIKSIPPSDKTVTHWDAQQPGFGLRVQPSGSMSLIAMYRIKGNPKLRLVTIAPVGAMTVEAARNRAHDLVAAARRGVDLDAETRAKALEEPASVPVYESLGTVVRRYLIMLEGETSERTGRKRTWSTIRATRLWLAGLEKFHDVPVNEVSAQQLRQVVADTPQASRRNVSGAIKRLFAWMRESGLIESDPSVEVKRARAPAARERTPSLIEVKRILEACDALLEDGSWEPVQQLAIKTLIFTGQRRADVTGMEWQDLDLRNATWTQPAIRNKSKRLHSVPLPSVLLTLLKEHYDESGRPSTGIVFPGVRSGRQMTAWMSDANEHLRERSGVEFVLHDLRRSIVSSLADHGIAFEVADAILNHARSASTAGVLGVYQRSSLDRRKREAMELWGSLLTREVGEGQGETQVLTFPARA